MTTKVTVDAHAGWPVRVMKIARSGALLLDETVPAGEVRDYHITQDDWLKTVEQERPA
jgi:hypothetical protein